MNPWLKFLGEIFKFIILITRRPRLLLFLLVFVIGIGGISIWISWYRWKHGAAELELDVYKNLATYLIAIVTTSFAERFILRKPDAEDERTLTVFAFGLGVAGIFSAVVMLMLTFTAISEVYLYARIGIITTLWLWFIAVANNPAFEEGSAISTLGGKV